MLSLLVKGLGEVSGYMAAVALRRFRNKLQTLGNRRTPASAIVSTRLIGSVDENHGIALANGHGLLKGTLHERTQNKG